MDIGLLPRNVRAVIGILTVALASESIFYIKLRKFHWNVKGESFMELHKLFEEQYDDISDKIDSLAERISGFGGNAIGTAEEFIRYSEVKEEPGHNCEQKEMLEKLVADHQTIIRYLRKSVDETQNLYRDTGTSNLLTDMMTDHEKLMWKINQYLQKGMINLND